MFGTDGIRGVFGEKITCSLAFDVGRAIGIKAAMCQSKGIVVGRDTRSSGHALTMALVSGILSQGVDVTDLGVVTSPAIGFITHKGYSFGVVITASHNLYEYNGIKIFNKLGMKLSPKDESEIENIVVNIDKYACCKDVGKFKKLAPKQYLEFLDSLLKGQKFDLRVCFDCANGAASGFVKRVFKNSFKELFLINTSSDGMGINKGCGATSVGELRQVVLQKKLDLGFAFDGDADRIIVIDSLGTTIDGDGILCILTQYLLDIDKFCGPIVGTIMTNSGLENFLKGLNIKLFRTPVGDKFISEHMLRHKLMLGGETSGHIILPELNPTGDGILCAILLILAVAKQGKNTKKMLSDYKQIPQHHLNIKYESDRLVAKCDLVNIHKIATKIAKKQLGKNFRLIVRSSGTEPVIRIMIEGEDEVRIKRVLGEIEKEISGT